jgi:3-methyl-2-oxobutanoate hydroxymethyltransferase
MPRTRYCGRSLTRPGSGSGGWGLRLAELERRLRMDSTDSGTPRTGNSAGQRGPAPESRHLKEGGAQAVKLEGGRRVLPQVTTLVDAGISVMGHLGLTPQSINMLGGTRRVQGQGDAGDQLLADALALERAWAFAVVLESVPASLGRRVSEQLRIPTIGIGAGPDCDAQIMVWQDMAGLTAGRLPRFVQRYADMRADLLAAASRFVADVADGRYSDQAHSYA